MPRSKDAKIWNEDLVTAFEARAQAALAQGKGSHLTWNKAADTIAAVRKDIYQAKTGRIFNLPENKLGKNALTLAYDIMQGRKNVLPDGYIPTNQQQAAQMGEKTWDSYPYLKKIKMRGGAYAILMAFHHSTTKTLDKNQICQLAQPYCDEEMEPNFHAGRQHGAWSSNKTLCTHNLLVKEGGRAQYVQGVGFRANGSTRLTLTRDGEQFIEAMLRKFHNADAPAAAPTSIAPLGMTHMPFDLLNAMHSLPMNRTPNHRKAAPLMDSDEAALRRWIATASVRESKSFDVSKARRSNLHDTCNRLELELPGLNLHHGSAGIGRDRTLIVTLLKKPGITGNIVGPLKRAVDPFSSGGHTLGSPEKKGRIPAKEAAAQAALERAAIEESKRMAMPVAMQMARRKLFNPAEEVEQIDLLSDSDDELPPSSSLTQEPVIVDISDNEEENQKVSGKRKKKPVVVDLFSDETISVPTAKKSSDLIILDSDDEVETDGKRPASPVANPYIRTMSPATDLPFKLFIDNRERNRNATPRLLRTELTRLIQIGQLKDVWPESMKDTVVEEVQLRFGDFSFQFEGRRIDVAVERKQIRDLVQRSTRGDHWKQLGKMRDNFRHSVFLLEIEERNAARFEAHGSEDFETWNPFNTVIDDERSFHLFLFRAVLSHRSVKFIQTREIQSSLRAVGALGLMAASIGIVMNEDAEEHAHPANEYTRLLKRLTNGGLPAPLADMVVKEYGSSKHLDAIYQECTDDTCKAMLMLPIVKNTKMENLVAGSDEAWSEAIFRAFYSVHSDPSKVVKDFQQYQELVEDHGELLCALHRDINPAEALDSAFSTPQRAPSEGRHVTVDVCRDHANLLPSPISDSFYTVNAFPFTPMGASIPTFVFKTIAGEFTSPKVVAQVLSGTFFIHEIKAVLNRMGSDYVKTAQLVAASIMMAAKRKGNERRILIVRGLPSAIEAEAKKAGYLPVIKTLLDLVAADLMLNHDVVLIQAVRQTGDVEAILQQLALACFHYQLLTNKNGR